MDTIESKIWAKLWQCTQVAHQDGFKFDMCKPDKEGNQIGIIFRFFLCEQIDNFLRYPHLRSDILLDAYTNMKKMCQGESLYGDVNPYNNKIEWNFE